MLLIITQHFVVSATTGRECGGGGSEALRPAFGSMRLDAIAVREIEQLKAKKLAAELSRKRVNNILAVLGKMLRQCQGDRNSRNCAGDQASRASAVPIRLSDLRGAGA